SALPACRPALRPADTLGSPFLFFWSVLLSLWRHHHPARRERTRPFGSPLEGIHPTVPSRRSVPRRGAREHPAPSNKERKLNMPSKSAQNSSQTKHASSSAKQTPVETFRLGRIKAAVWENEADSKKFYNVTFARTYKD